MKQGHPLAAFRERVFHLANPAGGAITGATFATTDLQIRKPSLSSYANCDSTQQAAVVELGGGDYAYVHTVAELGTAGSAFAFRVNKTGALPVTYVDDIEPAFFATALTGILTPTSFTTDRTETSDAFWVNALLVALSGSLVGQVKKIGSYTGSSKLVTLAAGLAFTGSPSNGDVFEILVR